ncbi:MAG: hypothetical protein B7X11_06535 [Acidobacteria bacterium 37-65-4]|nr:MAG: hypothetical protein B7X11_06535 [Acidobacteria bacterium 37-65-4]
MKMPPVGQGREEPLARRHVDGRHDGGGGQVYLLLHPVEAADGVFPDVGEDVPLVLGDQLDESILEGLLLAQGNALPHHLFGDGHVAVAILGEAPHASGQIVHHLLHFHSPLLGGRGGLGSPLGRLGRRGLRWSGDGNGNPAYGVGRPDVGPGGHGNEIAGHGHVGPAGGRPGSRRCDVGHHGCPGGEDRLLDLLHGAHVAAGGVDLQQDQAGSLVVGLADGVHDVLLNDGLYGLVHLDAEHALPPGGGPRKDRQNEANPKERLAHSSS